MTSLISIEMRLRAIEARFEPKQYDDKTKDIEYPEYIMTIVCDYFAMTKDVLCGKSRKREIVSARFIAVALICKHTKLSLKKIGSLFNNRDHSTVIHAQKEHEDRMMTRHKAFDSYKIDFHECENRFLFHINPPEEISEDEKSNCN